MSNRLVNVFAAFGSAFIILLYFWYNFVGRPLDLTFYIVPLILIGVTYTLLAYRQTIIARYSDPTPFLHPVPFRWVLAIKYTSFTLLVWWVLSDVFADMPYEPYLRRTIWLQAALVHIWFMRRYFMWDRPSMEEASGAGVRAGGMEGVIASLTESIPAAIADPGGIIKHATPALNELVGVLPGKLEGENLITIMPERYRERHLAGLAHYLKTGDTHILGKIVEVDLLKANGDEVPVYLALATTIAANERWFIGTIWERQDAR